MFGKSLLLDLYEVPDELIDNMDVAYRYLEDLVDVLDMTKQAPPYVIHAPRDHGNEVYPEKVGISAWIPLIESGIQIHTILPKRFVSIDIYTCGDLDTELILRYTKEIYRPARYDMKTVMRGEDY